MEWTESIRGTISYLEEHLLEDAGLQKLPGVIGISNFYLQKGFRLMTGYTIAEYVRNRRLYLAALDVIAGGDKVIDISFRYGYETPESFTKAFVRFHGVSPRELKKSPAKIRIFLPLKIKICIQGGYDMDYVVEDVKAFRLIGFEKEVPYESSFREVPKLWDEFVEKYMKPLMSKEKPEGSLEETICNCMVGEYGVCLEDVDDDKSFRYLMAGSYTEGEVPEGMTVYEFPDMQWAKFSCIGPLPEALQSINTKIFSEWLPENTEYEIATGANIEWYSHGDMSDPGYHSEIWIPVKKKQPA